MSPDRRWWSRLASWANWHRRELVVVGTFFALAMGWALCLPPSGSPDEASHYVRMIGMGDGHLIGRALLPDEGIPMDTPAFVKNPVMGKRVRLEAGAYWVPGSALPYEMCVSGNRVTPFVCPPPAVLPTRTVAISYHARVLPASYVVPGVLSRFASSTKGKLYLGRLGFALQDTALFAVAVFMSVGVLRGSRAETYALLLLAMTPQLMFQMGVLSPDGTEITAVLAFTAALLALVRAPSRRRVWAVAVLAAVSFWVRDLGLVFIPGIAAIAVVAMRRSLRPALAVIRRNLLAVGFVGATAIGAAAWRLLLQYNVKDIGLTSARLQEALEPVGRNTSHLWANVGWADVPDNLTLRTLWMVAFVALAVAIAARSWKWAVTSLSVWIFLEGLAIYLWFVLTAVGFGIQMRYVLALLPVTVLLPSGLFGRQGHNGPGRLAMAFAVSSLAAVGHLSVYVLASHRYANGINDRPISFDNTVWAPPFGWGPSLVAACFACVCVALLPALHWWRPARPDERTVATADTAA